MASHHHDAPVLTAAAAGARCAAGLLGRRPLEVRRARDAEVQGERGSGPVRQTLLRFNAANII